MDVIKQICIHFKANSTTINITFPNVCLICINNAKITLNIVFINTIFNVILALLMQIKHTFGNVILIVVELALK